MLADNFPATIEQVGAPVAGSPVNAEPLHAFVTHSLNFSMEWPINIDAGSKPSSAFPLHHSHAFV
jgi:hypothetical protein